MDERSLAALRLEDFYSETEWLDEIFLTTNTLHNKVEKKEKQEVYEVSLLLERLRDSSTMKPFAMFTVTRSAFLGAFGTVLTYLVVLIQFKVAEQTSGTTTNNSTNSTNSTSLE